MRCTCSMVECFLLNPNWCSGIICVDCKMGCIRVIKEFLKTFKRGLEVDWLACRTLHLLQVYQVSILWQFGIPSTVQGKYPVRKMLLYMYVIADNPTSGNFLRIAPVMRSYRGAFPLNRQFVPPQHSDWHELTGNTNKTSTFHFFISLRWISKLRKQQEFVPKSFTPDANTWRQHPGSQTYTNTGTYSSAITQSPIYHKSNDLYNVILKVTVFAKRHYESVL